MCCVFAIGAMSQQRSRTRNFSEDEEEILVKLANNYKQIIENKTTSAVNTKAKKDAWEQIAVQFNAMCPHGVRSAPVLRNKYDNIKKLLRQTKAKERREAMATGGGKAPEPWQAKNEALKELSETIALSVEGLPSSFDDDCESTTTVALEIDVNESTATVASEIDDSTSTTTVASNMDVSLDGTTYDLENVPIDYVLTDADIIEHIDISTGASQIPVQSSTADGTFASSSIAAGTSMSQSFFPHTSPSLSPSLSLNSIVSGSTSALKKSKAIERWKNYSPASLKSAVSVALKHSRESESESIAALKKRYLQREYELLEEKAKGDAEERRLRIERETEEHALKMKLLQAKLDHQQMRKSKSNSSSDDY